MSWAQRTREIADRQLLLLVGFVSAIRCNSDPIPDTGMLIIYTIKNVLFGASYTAAVTACTDKSLLRF